MDIDVQEVLVALVLLVPGFIATGILRAFIPTRYSSDLEWIVTSLLIAICLNALLLAVLMLVEAGELKIKIGESLTILKNLELQRVAIYVVVLYLGAVGWGTLAGMLPVMSPRAFLNRVGLVTFAEHESVWNRILDVRRPRDRPVTWLKIHTKEGKTLFGHLRHCSEHIDKDEPFELYLTEVQVKEQGRDWIPIEADGVYHRLLPMESAEIHFKPRDWKPEVPLNPT